MKHHDEEVQKLVRLKRYETPREGYFEDFLSEFQERQRAELLKKSSRSLFFERVGTTLRQVSSVRWVTAGGVAYAAIMAAIFFMPRKEIQHVSPNSQPIIFEPSEVPVLQPVKPDEKTEPKVENLNF